MTTAAADTSTAPPKRSPLRSPTLAECLRQPQDNFLLLRFIAASMVIFGHSYAVSGIPGAGDFIARMGLGYGLYTGSIAVDMFFVISGFLVTASYIKRDSLLVFVRARALRIVPGYAACMLLTAFVFGAIYTELPIGDYLLDPATRDYVFRNVQFSRDMAWTLPGVFVHNPLPNTVNGSIWTLPGEVRVYVWVAALGFVGLLRRRWSANVALILLIACGVIEPFGWKLMFFSAYLPLAGFFALGAFAYVNRDWIPVSGMLAGIMVLICIATRRSEVFIYLFALTLSYLCLWFAYRPRLFFFNRFGDYSYGIYLWGFPLQQMVAQAMGGMPRPIYIFALSLPLAILFGALSWYGVEKPALRFKRKTPRPGMDVVGV